MYFHSRLKTINGVLATIVVSVFCNACDGDEQSREYHDSDMTLQHEIQLSNLLANPPEFDGQVIDVVGVVLWHENEPTLFADWNALENFDVRKSIQLELTDSVNYQGSRKSEVIVTGHFNFNAANQQEAYKGVLRVMRIAER